MRIAFVSDAVYPWNIGGIETLESIESKELARAHEVHFFSSRWPGMRREFTRNGIRFHTLNDVNKDTFYRHGRRSIREAIKFTLGLFRLFNYRFDVIQANEFPVLHLPLLKLYCLLFRCRLILDVAEVWDRRYWGSYLGWTIGGIAYAYANAFITTADMYIANSSVTASMLERSGVDKNRIRVFTPVIDDKLMRNLKPIGSTDIVFYGRLIKEKRLDRWLDIVKRVSARRRSLKALIIGEGPDSGNVRRTIRRLGLGKVVEFRGFYSERDKRTLFGRVKGSKLLLQMSEREGLSLVVPESLALGTPVVLPDYSPIPNEVKRMCVVEPPDRIPSTILRMLKSRNKRRHIRNPDDIKKFMISNVNRFYSDLFAAMML